MSDIAVQYSFNTDLGSLAADIEMNGHDLRADDGLHTAVVISLFTDRRAHDDDVLPDGGDNRRGWFGDAWPDVDGDQIGSRLWLLSREKQTQEVLNRAREYADEALQWLIEDGVAKTVKVETSIVRTGILGIFVEITRPDGTVAPYRFEKFWSAN